MEIIIRVSDTKLVIPYSDIRLMKETLRYFTLSDACINTLFILNLPDFRHTLKQRYLLNNFFYYTVITTFK